MSAREEMPDSDSGDKKRAYQFIVLMGLVSLFGDITYEGARSIIGPYLATLGASAGVVGLIAGLGELSGYGLRLIFGYLADRTKNYWLFTIVGYGLIISVPLLAFTSYWPLAALLVILERTGKAIRSPARDTILSHATEKVGRGWGFGIHEFIDQIGAIAGPLVLSAALLFGGGYRGGLTLLWIPVISMLAVLSMARLKFPEPEKFEAQGKRGEGGFSRVFWIYSVFIALSVIGFASFQLISYHLKVASVVPEGQIPIFYAVAMGVDALIALIIGKIYDKFGLRSLAILPILTIPLPILAFSKSYLFAVLSAILWGAVMGVHETVMRAAIADLVPLNRRGSAYGIFNVIYGGAFFLGSSVMGWLYSFELSALIWFSIATELCALAVFFSARRLFSKEKR